jgi:hypothetical protein
MHRHGLSEGTDRGHESRRGNLASRAFRLRNEAAPLPIAASAGTPRRGFPKRVKASYFENGQSHEQLF